MSLDEDSRIISSRKVFCSLRPEGPNWLKFKISAEYNKWFSQKSSPVGGLHWSKKNSRNSGKYKHQSLYIKCKQRAVSRNVANRSKKSRITAPRGKNVMSSREDARFREFVLIFIVIKLHFLKLKYAKYKRPLADLPTVCIRNQPIHRGRHCHHPPPRADPERMRESY